MTPSPNIRSAVLVMGSGGARAAYEVGVARFPFEDLPARLGRLELSHADARAAGEQIVDLFCEARQLQSQLITARR